MSIYILELPKSDLTGFMGGVDFCGGRGSTNSKADADRLVSVFGCRIVEVKEDRPAFSAPAVEKAGAKAREDSTAPRVFVNKADRLMHEKLVRRHTQR
jgi:hypothetical protein